MRRLIAWAIFLLAFLTPALVSAQGFIPGPTPPWAFADDFGRWSFRGQALNTFTFTPSQSVNGCLVTNYNENQPQFLATGASVGFAPVLIYDDGNPTNSEIVTPTSTLAPTQTTCGWNLSAVNTHKTFHLQSGTAGLQEAINTLGTFTTPYPSVVYLTPNWYKLVNGITTLNATLASTTPASIIAALKGSVQVIIVDITQATPVTYVWHGVAAGYVSGTQYWAFSTTKPTGAAGLGAGTGPTLTVTGNSVTGTVTLTTGTSVPAAADPIFTLTWPSPGTAGSPTSGWNFAPTCTFTSTGTSPGTTTNSAVIGPPPVATLTSPAAGLSSSTAGYAWTYLCH